MSVVGPRPHFVEHDAHFESIDPLYRLRKFVKPGITGLAQVAGYRGETKTRADVRGRSYTDLEYLENWSLRLDLVIVLKTIGAVFRPPRTAR
jgi:lipopolysaccharide/colanic/teichoic acid biosynthesis glycosyltransferase